MSGGSLALEHLGSSSGHCDCCGNTSRRVWGQIANSADSIVAIYYVGWTERRPDHGADWDFVLGAWGEQTSSADRFVASLEYRPGGGFMFRDASSEYDSIARRQLKRDDLLGSPIGDQLFALIDQIWLNDCRIAEICDWAA